MGILRASLYPKKVHFHQLLYLVFQDLMDIIRGLVTQKNYTLYPILYPPNTDAEVLNRMKVAGVDEVCDSMKEQLIALVNWAQTIPAFMKFNQSDKVALLRARAGEHLLLGAAWRSIGVDDVLLLGNDCIIPKDASELIFIEFMCIAFKFSIYQEREINRIGRRVMNELVKTFRETRMDENEFVCLKAIVFFDPSIKGLGVNAVKKVKDIRYRVQLILEDYIKNRNIESRGRFGLLLLSLQVLQSIAWQMVEQIQFAELFGGAKVDKLLAEMLLGVK
ncbi:Hepatocyte nuclear factor 4-beta [Armadillidium nasatum]|uniref:Hepatocyte nuclear factor 4-beta n=1 Tax=Armadillidium nasatum TaxID=96803 RepID=A0A5N5T6E6_9CRUS|nr:Hepatocyte nuclear factor 4-beta [Armadillidium nasatum]